MKFALAIVTFTTLLVAASCGGGSEDSIGSDTSTATTAHNQSQSVGELNANVDPTIAALAEARPCVVLDWDEAQAATSFDLVKPAAIPASFTFSGYALIEPPTPGSGAPDCTSGIDRVEMQFQVEGSDFAYAMLIQGTPPPPNYVDSVDEEGETVGGKRVVRSIEQTTGEATIVRFDWISGDRYFTLYGPVGPNLTEEELVEMLASIPN